MIISEYAFHAREEGRAPTEIEKFLARLREKGFTGCFNREIEARAPFSGLYKKSIAEGCGLMTN